MISLLLTILVLGFASDSCNNKDIILILGYNYNIILIFSALYHIASSMEIFSHDCDLIVIL